jgi:hypothetical protein
MSMGDAGLGEGVPRSVEARRVAKSQERLISVDSSREREFSRKVGELTAATIWRAL